MLAQGFASQGCNSDLTSTQSLDKTIPENFLEETQPQPVTVQKPKGRQRKGCLYRYIENKKLKSGAIALVRSMQNEGVSLEEIIGFIKRAKSKTR